MKFRNDAEAFDYYYENVMDDIDIERGFEKYCRDNGYGYFELFMMTDEGDREFMLQEAFRTAFRDWAEIENIYYTDEED